MEVQFGRHLPSGGVEGNPGRVDLRGVAVQFQPAAELHRTEAAAQILPHRGLGMMFGKELLLDRTGEFQHLIDQERQQRQRGENIRQMTGSVPEVVFQALGVLQNIEGFVLVTRPYLYRATYLRVMNFPQKRESVSCLDQQAVQ